MPYLLAFLLFFAAVTQSVAQSGSEPNAAAAVKGDVLYWEGEELVVKEMSGREVRLRVTPQTKIEGVVVKLKTGDKIAAQVKPDGSAVSITLQIPDSGTVSSAPGLR